MVGYEMHLLIIGMNYAPEVTGIAPYTAGLAEHLAELGHKVTVATTFPHYPQWRVQQPYEGRWRSIEQRGGVLVRRSRVVLPRGGSAASRIAYDSSLAVGTLLNSITAPAADMVLCVSPPIQLALTGALLARRSRARLAVLVQDLPLDAAVAMGMMKDGPVHSLGRAMERLAYRLADRIIVISAGFRESLLRQGVPANKITEIPDWANTDTVRPMPAEPGLRELLGAAAGDFLLLHTGNMGEKQGLASAVAAASLANGRANMQLTLVGDGSDRPRLAELAARQGLSNVKLLPLQPSELFPRLLASADALLLNQRANVVDSVAPSKLLSYMAAGRPVVAAVHPSSEAARVVTVANCGVVVPPEDPRALATAVRRIAEEPALAAELGANGRAYVEAHYARDRVLQRYEEFLTSMIGQR